MLDAKPYKSLDIGDRVKVVQQSALPYIKMRRYQVVGLNTTYDLIRLEWIDAPPRSTGQFMVIPSDYVRLCSPAPRP